MAKKRKVTKGYLGSDWKSKRVERTTKRGSTIREKEDQYNEGYLGHEPKEVEYNDKKLWSRRFKSKKDKEGTEKRRSEKIIYDDGNQSKKRTQRKIRFGKNKGKIKSKTVHWDRGKKTVTKRILDATDKSKLKKGGARNKDAEFKEAVVKSYQQALENAIEAGKNTFYHNGIEYNTDTGKQITKKRKSVTDKRTKRGWYKEGGFKDDSFLEGPIPTLFED
tara:strand:+ start:713 stop:1372 length:660 start_codon:yes stop_codon:yes gene_type:complete